MQENNNNLQYRLIKLSEQHIPQAMAFTCTYYIASEPLSQHLGIKSENFEKASEKLITDCIRSGFSFAFTKQGKIVAIMLAVPYKNYSKSMQKCEESTPIQEIIDTIYKTYQPANPQKTLSMFVGCTVSQHTKKGLFSKLVQQAEKHAIEEGYIEFLADCTNRASENALLKLGYRELRKIDYDTFELEGNFPFKNIEFPGAEGLVLLSKILQSI